MNVRHLTSLFAAMLLGLCPCRAEELAKMPKGDACPTVVVQVPMMPLCVAAKVAASGRATPRDAVLHIVNRRLAEAQRKYGGTRIELR